MDRFLNQIICGDCLEVMRDIPDKSVDMILCDLPYGTTACKWDTIIPFEPLWEQYERIIKDNGAIVLNGSQPFTSRLIMSNLRLFKYTWVWDKSQVTGFLNSKKQPLRQHEDICVFYKRQCIYNPIMKKGKRTLKATGSKSENYGKYTYKPHHSEWYYPKSILEFPQKRIKGGHPTQKPVDLMEYLIKTYTNEGEIVLDNCIGSGTTAVASLNTGRFFIGIEKEPKYCEIARKRVEQAQSQQSLFA